MPRDRPDMALHVQWTARTGLVAGILVLLSGCGSGQPANSRKETSGAGGDTPPPQTTTADATGGYTGQGGVSATAGMMGSTVQEGGREGTSTTSSGGNAAGAQGSIAPGGPSVIQGPRYTEIQKIFNRTCAMSTCHTSGPTCPLGTPVGTPAAEDCPDPDPIGWRNQGLDLSSPEALEKTAINQYASQPRLDRTCGKYLDLAPRYASTRLKRIIPGDSRHSYLVMKLDWYDREQKLAGTDGSRCHGGTMPHSSKSAAVKLTLEEVSKIRSWIDSGASLSD